MKSQLNKAYRRAKKRNADAVFLKKEAQAEQTFFGAQESQPFFNAATQLVQRKCQDCKDEDQKVHRSATDNSGTVADKDPELISSESGKTLPGEAHRFFGGKIGVDFSNVRIHTGSDAARSAKSINAKAYTLGNHIVFGEGQYQPDTHEGKKLIAHELTHVVQQSGTAAPLLQRAPDTKDELQKTYKINIKKGDKDWTSEEITTLKSALGRLVGDETSVVRDYQFIRWSTKAARAKMDTSYKDPGTSECALHEMDLGTASYKISVYDACFSDPEARAGTDTTFGIDTGEFHIMHEIGHAMEVAELRKTYEAAVAADKAYNDYIEKNKDKDATKAMQAEADRLSKAAEDAKQSMTDATDRGLKEFTGLMKGKDAITKYGGEGDSESFAEMFAAFKANPELVKKDYPAVYTWLSEKGYLKHIVKKK